jgi:hypothetical protein
VRRVQRRAAEEAAARAEAERIAVAVGGVSTAVIGGVTLVATLGCFGAEMEFADEAECYKVAAFGAGFTVAAAGTTVKVWYSVKENRP